MANKKRLLLRALIVSLPAVVAGLLLASPAELHAQLPQTGQNAVMNPSLPTQAQKSPAFIDASIYAPSSNDVCIAINNALGSSGFNPGNSNGIVVDARGVGSGLSTIPCSISPVPSLSGTHSNNEYATTILLPSGTIGVQTTWILPSQTRIVGAGSGLSGAGLTGITVLAACTATLCGSGHALSGDFIDMGSVDGTSTHYCPPQGTSGYDCVGVVLEHLQLDATGATSLTTGIKNVWSQELSYVNDIKLTNFAVTGLQLGDSGIGTGPGNSGPYTRIYYSGTGPCLNITNTNDSRGVHGLTCITSNATGISIDSTNESIEDVTIVATGAVHDGILIGSNLVAASNVLFNISGSTASGGSLFNLIHISNHTTSGIPNGSDQTIMGVSNSSGGNTIQDDLSVATLTDTTLGIYVLGEAVLTGSTPLAYSRFTTSQQVPTWLVGTSSPTGTGCKVGTLFSCIGTGTCGSSPKTLYACVNTSGSTVWKALI